MANIPYITEPLVEESEIKVFQQGYYVVPNNDENAQGAEYKLRRARVEVLADEDGVFLESKGDGGGVEHLSIPTPDLAVAVARYILSAYEDWIAEDE